MKNSILTSMCSKYSYTNWKKKKKKSYFDPKQLIQLINNSSYALFKQIAQGIRHTNLITKWKTNEEPSSKEKPFWGSNPVENSLEERVTVVYLQNICTTRFSIVTSANAPLAFPSQWLRTCGILLCELPPRTNLVCNRNFGTQQQRLTVGEITLWFQEQFKIKVNRSHNCFSIYKSKHKDRFFCLGSSRNFKTSHREKMHKGEEIGTLWLKEVWFLDLLFVWQPPSLSLSLSEIVLKMSYICRLRSCRNHTYSIIWIQVLTISLKPMFSKLSVIFNVLLERVLVRLTEICFTRAILGFS